MNILMVYPKYPPTYWSFSHALRFISKKAAVPPLGLITVSAMLPKTWNRKLIDMNVTDLTVKDLKWADFVFLSAMYIQKESVNTVLEMCVAAGTKIVAGGPLFTQEFDNYPQIDHFILNEAEISLQPFLKDLEDGTDLKKIYRTDEYANMIDTPIPDYHLLNMKSYAFMNLQVSRGCPFACSFCEITALLGRKVRMKSSDQVLEELDALYKLNWRGPVAVVDDNFIGRIKDVKTNLLPAMKGWMKAHKYPFVFNAQTSINLADDDELLKLMTDTGFDSTFIGIETPAEDALKGCNKVQNNNRDLIQSIKKIQTSGLQVSGGFIVGFDSDSSTIFQRQIDFIQKSGIVSAMVGLLNAPKNTDLYRQLEAENRLTEEATGSNTDSSMNFTPAMNKSDLVDGYNKIIENIYSVKPYYKRARQFLNNYKDLDLGQKKIEFTYLIAFVKSIIIIGLVNKGRREYWKFILWTLFKKPSLIVDAITFTVYGYHYRTVYGLRGIKRN